MKILNIFCDASIKKLSDRTIGCAGFVTNQYIQSYVYLDKCTNNLAEIVAILISIQYAISERDNYDRINIFSDSKISVYGIRHWMKDWYKNKRQAVLYNSEGYPVKNQDYFVHIANMICANNFKLNLYHQKGHVRDHAPSDIANAIKVFNSSNKILIDRNNVRLLSRYNDYVDKLTKDRLDKFDKNNLFVQFTTPLAFNIDKYMELVKLNRDFLISYL